MKQTYRSILLFTILFSFQLFSQTNTFIKNYSRGGGCSVIQTKDSGYLIGSYLYYDKIVILTKTDNAGNLIWEKKFENLTEPLPYFLRVVQHSDEGYSFVGTKEGNDTNVCLYRLNKSGDTIWTKTYLTTACEFGKSFVLTDDGGYLIAGTHQALNSPDKTMIIKADYDGNLIKRKLFSFPTSSITFLDIQKTFDNNFMLYVKGRLFKISDDGDSLWVKNLSKSCTDFFQTSDSGFVLCGEDFLMKTDKIGNKIWTKNYSNWTFRSVIQTEDGGFALVDRGILKTDADGNKLWEIVIPNYFYEIQSTGDKGFILAGHINNYISLIKTDANGNASGVALTSFNDAQSCVIGREYIFYWYSQSISNVNIDLTTNGGASWDRIASVIPDSGFYKFAMEGKSSDKCKLKVSDANNPTLFDESNEYFSITYNSTSDFIAINQIMMFVGNNGMGSHDPRSDGAGLYWPGGKYATIGAVFQDGLIWGGKVNGVINVNGSTYRSGLQPGKILSCGLPDTTTKPIYNIWKIRRDWESLPPRSERAAFEYNYDNWPGELGAPYEDIDHDGQYTKEIDKPKYEGDETLWFVANDLDSAITQYTYGSEPIGLEVQVTTYGYNRTDDLADVVFKKYKIINKSTTTVEDMYFGYWSDTDLGDGSDDYVGCDSILNLGYAYNSSNNDQAYGAAPPALGYFLLQGPTCPSKLSDSAYFDGRWVKEKKNLTMSAYAAIFKTWLYALDPPIGYNGSLGFYYYLKGSRYSYQAPELPYIDPYTGDTTKFPLSGDPVFNTGWYEGNGWPGGPFAGDRRHMISSGPFNFAPGDTQEVVYAIIIGRGTDNINSVKVLKDKTKAVKNFYYLGILDDVAKSNFLPKEFKLYQNFPNPFNPTTTIKYSIPERSRVELKIFDVLGKEVATLVNEEKSIGNYEVHFDGSNLSSGVYIYRLKAGNFFNTKKIVLIK
ncbi:MAG: T9SS type A sorting domain-containing protein [Ignavibacteriales bacterium]|nr:T9SS type A sorting domain-containing protein [Ignavibacteriales bacterium]